MRREEVENGCDVVELLSTADAEILCNSEELGEIDLSSSKMGGQPKH
jgi:hypothetical protein